MWLDFFEMHQILNLILQLRFRQNISETFKEFHQSYKLDFKAFLHTYTFIYSSFYPCQFFFFFCKSFSTYIYASDTWVYRKYSYLINIYLTPYWKYIFKDCMPIVYFYIYIYIYIYMCVCVCVCVCVWKTNWFPYKPSFYFSPECGVKSCNIQIYNFSFFN